MENRRIPVTLVTGFLGSGKSTLIGRVIEGAVPRRIAVIENELAEVGVDQLLLAGSAGDVTTLAGGCVCCSARGDLRGAVRSVCAGSPMPDAILIETSGIARVSSTAADLIELGISERNIWLRAVVVVVDAVNAVADAARPEFIDQVASADFVVLSKDDLANPKQRQAAREAVRAVSPAALALAVDVSVRDVLGTVGEQAESAFAPTPGVYGLGHEIEAVSVALPGDLDAARFRTILDELAADAAVLRVKGFVSVSGEVRLVQGVHNAVDTLPWRSAQPVELALVIIGEGLDEQDFRRRLWASRS